MASPTSVLSKTLQSITRSKIRELESCHKSYEARKSDLLAQVDAATEEQDRLSLLLDAFRELYPGAHGDVSLHNVERWIAQSRYDASIPVSKLMSFGRELREKLDHQSRRLNMAHLYSRLLTGKHTSLLLPPLFCDIWSNKQSRMDGSTACSFIPCCG